MDCTPDNRRFGRPMDMVDVVLREVNETELPIRSGYEVFYIFHDFYKNIFRQLLFEGYKPCSDILLFLTRANALFGWIVNIFNAAIEGSCALVRKHFGMNLLTDI